MVVVHLVPGKSEVLVAAWARGHKLPRPLTEVPGGLHPLMSAAFEIDEYRMMSGWPVPVPDYDFRADVSVSAEGIALEDRDPPLSVITGADLRWVADANYYDETTVSWNPVVGTIPWTAAPDNLPTLITDYTYVLGDERFTSMTCLNFDSDTFDWMQTDLDSTLGGTYGYTVIMVLSPNSVYGNSDYAESALWASEEDGHWTSFTVRGQSVWVVSDEKPAQEGPKIGDALNSTAVSYLVLVVGRPQTRLYASSGPSDLRKVDLVTGTPNRPLNTRFRLGSRPSKPGETPAATMDMALFDLGIYGNLLTAAQISAEITLLAQAYGDNV